jgi:hypothetical protein
MGLTKQEKALYLASGESVEDCIISAERWVANREQLWDALDDLETRTELVVYHWQSTPLLALIADFHRNCSPSRTSHTKQTA